MKYHPESGKVYFTYDSIEKLPEWPDGPLIEILNGDIFMVPSPSLLHQKVALNIATAIKSHVDEGKLGDVFTAPVDVILSNENVTVPDIVFVSSAKNTILTPKNIRGVPDLVVEILSQNKNRDMVHKKALYESFSVPEYWVVDIEEKSVLAFRIDEKGKTYRKALVFRENDEVRSAVLPELKMNCRNVFK
ncbi:MAG: Uma2 family endonuclease [Candidatus Lokiarchaeota archaeon]|nr:Uma2 family endonuclease [Candidatus Lokiarchaeota archaeon]